MPLLVRIKNFLSPSHLAVEEECLLCLPLDEIMKYPLDSLCVCVPPPSALERKKRKEERVGGWSSACPDSASFWVSRERGNGTHSTAFHLAMPLAWVNCPGLCARVSSPVKPGWWWCLRHSSYRTKGVQRLWPFGGLGLCSAVMRLFGCLFLSLPGTGSD